MNDILELFRIYGTIELEGADKADKQLDNIDNKAKGATGGIKGFVQGIGKVAAGIGVFALVSKAIDTVKQSVDGAIDRYDTLNNFPRVMQQLGFDATDSDKSIKRLSDGIQGLPTRLDEVASTAQNIAIMTKDLDGATNTTLALNNAFLASGSSSQDAERGLNQYVQMLSKGEVDLQSWRTLQETMGLGLNQLAEDFGYTGASAQNDLYDALKDGKITFDEFNAALIDASERTGGFAEMALTSSGGLKTAFTNFKTWVVMGVADVISAFDDVLGGTGSIEQGILKLKPVIQGVFGWIANTAIPAVGDGVQFIRDKLEEWRPTIDRIREAFQPFVERIKGSFDTLKGHLTPIWEDLKGLFESLKPILELIGAAIVVMYGVWLSVFSGVVAAIGPVINAVINLVDFVVNMVNVVIALLTGDFAGAWEFWKAAGQSAIDFFWNLMNGVIDLLVTFVDTIIDYFKSLYMALVGNSIIPDMVNAIIDWFKDLFKWAIDLVKNIVTGIVQGFQDMYNRVSSVMRMINTIISSILNYVKNTFRNALMFLKGLVTGDFGMMRQAVQNQMQNIRNLITNIVNALPGVFRSGLARVVSNIRSGMQNALSAVTGMASRFLQAGRNIVTSIADGIKGAIGKVTGAISDVASKVRNFLPFSPAKEGPLSDLNKLDFEGPIGDSIERGENALRAKMAEMLGNVHPTANFNVGGRGVTTKSNAQNTSVVAKTQNNEMIELLKEVVQAIKDGKVINVDGRVLGEINDGEQGKRINLSGRVAY